MRQRDRYIHIYSAIEMSLMYRDSWWNTDIRFWRSWPLSLHIMIFIDLEHEHVILWFGGVYVHRMVAPIKYGKGQRLTVFFKFLCMVSWCNEKYWKKWDHKNLWYHGMEKLNGKWCYIQKYYSVYIRCIRLYWGFELKDVLVQCDRTKPERGCVDVPLASH